MMTFKKRNFLVLFLKAMSEGMNQIHTCQAPGRTLCPEMAAGVVPHHKHTAQGNPTGDVWHKQCQNPLPLRPHRSYPQQYQAEDAGADASSLSGQNKTLCISEVPRMTRQSQPWWQCQCRKQATAGISGLLLCPEV